MFVCFDNQLHGLNYSEFDTHRLHISEIIPDFVKRFRQIICVICFNIYINPSHINMNL